MTTTERPERNFGEGSGDRMPDLRLTPGQVLTDQFGNRMRIWAISITDENQLLVSLADQGVSTKEASDLCKNYSYSAVLQRVNSGFYTVENEPDDIALLLPPPGAVIFKRTQAGHCEKVGRICVLSWQVASDGTPPLSTVIFRLASNPQACPSRRGTTFYQDMTARGWFMFWTLDMLRALDPGLPPDKHLW